jgi:hypothetical protein
MSETNTFKTRLQEEKAQLGERLVKLKTFLDGEKIKELEQPHQALLRVQYAAMCTYWECLESRYSMLPD